MHQSSFNTPWILAIALVLTTTMPFTANAEGRFLRSADNLDDPSGYCLDIPGFGPRMRKDAPTTTHTCKYNRPGFYVDEIFEVTSAEQLRLPEYDLCLSTDAKTGANVYTLACEATARQQWLVTDAGHVSPKSNTDLCITLAAEKVYVNTSHRNLIPNSTRSITLQKCGSTEPRYQAWKWSAPDEQDTPSANMLRAGMPIEIASKIKEMGPTVNPPKTAALYENAKRLFSEADVNISEKIQYGDNDNHLLQVYTGKNRNHPRNAAPILMLVHGGGFARGGLQDMKLVAIHFAAMGYVVVNTTYPLLPEARWPSGGQSVAAAVNWIKKNAKDFKANPDKIFALGTSAGGANLAEFVFRSDILEGEIPTIAGAILGSPAGLTMSANAHEGILAYIGNNPTSWAKKQTIGNIERSSIPVLLAVAEYDPRALQLATAKLYSDLLQQTDAAPRITQIRGHNHSSYIYAIGTFDNQFTQEILDFIDSNM